MEYTYNWGHALAVGKFLNLFQRNADIIGLATWAQTVNVLSPIMTSKTGSFRQTIYTTLKAYRQNTLANNLPLAVHFTEIDKPSTSIDAVASISDDRKEITLSVLNLSDQEIPLKISFESPILNEKIGFSGLTSYSAPSLDSENDFDKESVKETKSQLIKNVAEKFEQTLKPSSVNFLRFRLF